MMIKMDPPVTSSNVPTKQPSSSASSNVFSICFYSLILYPVYYIFRTLANYSLILSNYRSTWNPSVSKSDKNCNDSSNLFPSKFNLLINLTTKDLNQCSTSLDSKLISFTNRKGELEFKIVENDKANIESKKDYPKQELSPISDISNSPLVKREEKSLVESAKGEILEETNSNSSNNNNTNGFLSLSPVSSIKSSNSSIHSVNNNNNVSSISSVSEHDEEEDEEGEEPDGIDDDKVHQCPYCDSKFRIRGYLTRHIKKHSKTKAYKCPFFHEDSSVKCHSTGGFSRRDTYKTHLKARHFKYPPGIKSGDRIGMTGWCGVCGEKFLNNEIWVERHIELGLCPGLPNEYIKNLKIGKKKTGKHSKFLDVIDNKKNKNPILLSSSSPSSISSPSIDMKNEEAEKNIFTTPMSLDSTPSPIISSTATTMTPQIYQIKNTHHNMQQNIQQNMQQNMQKNSHEQNQINSFLFKQQQQNLANAFQLLQKQQQQQQNYHSLQQNLQYQQNLQNQQNPNLSSSILGLDTMNFINTMGINLNMNAFANDSNFSSIPKSIDEEDDEENYPSLDGECSPYSSISYPMSYYKPILKSENNIIEENDFKMISLEDS